MEACSWTPPAGFFKSRHWRGAAGGEHRDRGHLVLVRGWDALDPGVLAPAKGRYGETHAPNGDF